jgi:hypothetical protein
MAAYWQGDYAAVRAAYEKDLGSDIGDWARRPWAGQRLAMRQATSRSTLARRTAWRFSARRKTSPIAIALAISTLALKDGDLDRAAAHYQTCRSIKNWGQAGHGVGVSA